MASSALKFKITAPRIDRLVGVAEEVLNDVHIDALKRANKAVTPKAKSIVPVDTGKLKRSIHSKLIKSSKPFKSRSVFTADARNERTGDYYGNYIEFGRGPVTAKKAPALHFYNRRAGQWMTRGSVGRARKFPFLGPAIEYAFGTPFERAWSNWDERYVDRALRKRGL